jgi:hypothetical protein
MPVHFLNGTVSGPQNLAGPDSLLVDPLAEVNGGASAALTLTSGPWTITVKGNVHSSGDEAIVLQDAGAFVSTMTIGKDATIATTALNEPPSPPYTPQISKTRATLRPLMASLALMRSAMAISASRT